jgi:hypothetical protein
MDLIDRARRAATMPIPGATTPEELRRALDALTMPDLAALWCSLQYLGLRDKHGEAWARLMYFDHLPHDAPERAFELVRAVLASEAHKHVKMQLNGKLMLVLVGNPAMTDRIIAEARSSAALRWLLGGCRHWASEADEPRYRMVANEAAWRRDADARDRPPSPIDFASLSTPVLALIWIDQHCKPDKDRDANFSALGDYERELRDDDPDRLIDLILDILRIEHDPAMLSYLAAGPLEDVVSMATIERIEREAANSAAFCALLGGVWYSRAEPELKARLDAIVEGAHGRNWRN